MVSTTNNLNNHFIDLPLFENDSDYSLSESDERISSFAKESFSSCSLDSLPEYGEFEVATHEFLNARAREELFCNKTTMYATHLFTTSLFSLDSDGINLIADMTHQYKEGKFLFENNSPVYFDDTYEDFSHYIKHAQELVQKYTESTAREPSKIEKGGIELTALLLALKYSFECHSYQYYKLAEYVLNPQIKFSNNDQLLHHDRERVFLQAINYDLGYEG